MGKKKRRLLSPKFANWRKANGIGVDAATKTVEPAIEEDKVKVEEPVVEAIADVEPAKEPVAVIETVEEPVVEKPALKQEPKNTTVRKTSAKKTTSSTTKKTTSTIRRKRTTKAKPTTTDI